MNKPITTELASGEPALVAIGRANDGVLVSLRAPVERPPCLRHFGLAGLAAGSRDALAAARSAPEANYLLEYLDGLVPAGQSWGDALDAYLSRPTDEDQILIGLGRDLRFHLAELMAVALAVAVEDDMMVGRVLSYLQAPVGGSRPTLGLLHAAFSTLAGKGELAIDSISTGAAVRCGLLVIGNDGAPRPERSVSVPLPLCLALRGVNSDWPGTSALDSEHVSCQLPRSISAMAAQHAAWLTAAPSQALVIRGGSPIERRSAASFIARLSGLKPALLNGDGKQQEGGARNELNTAGLGVWARLGRRLPVLPWELAPGESRSIPRVPGYDGPLIALNGPDGSVTCDGGAMLTWTLPVPSGEERRALWQIALGDDELANDLAYTHRHRAGRISQLAGLARQRAALEKRLAMTQEDLTAAAWASEGVGLASLAQPLATPVPDEALVVTAQLGKDLGDLLARCRARDSINKGLGPSIAARYHPGVKALFCGPSGSGKTLTAGWLATKLAMPLYRVDLAAMTSKYIGETEKNLAQLLARAEDAEVILLFDEADSLFGKRTDVKESNDRFANAQTNYLLQRIESFDGVALLTSNSRTRFDAAFMRRLDVVIDFPLPGPEERRSLWLSHLGPAHKLTQQELNQISASADLAGGHIRNAVISAAVRAAGRAIGFSDVAHGIATEYRKLGKQMPANLLIERAQNA